MAEVLIKNLMLVEVTRTQTRTYTPRPWSTVLGPSESICNFF